MRLQLVVDDFLGHELQEKAHAMGFSTSAYLRYLVRKSLGKNKTKEIDLAIEDIEKGNVEKITLEDFNKQLEDLY
jgi:hypothetical protein